MTNCNTKSHVPAENATQLSLLIYLPTRLQVIINDFGFVSDIYKVVYLLLAAHK